MALVSTEARMWNHQDGREIRRSMAFLCRLSQLGERICVMGPSNSGKSTLADAIARKLALRAIHLDQLYHLPNTNWQVRPEEQFLALHDEAISGARWVIDGNYSKCLPQRLQCATGMIILDVSTGASLFRYVRRTISDPRRIGALEGGQDSIKMGMLHHILMVTPANRKRYADLFQQLSLPKVYLPSIRAIKACYRDWGLEAVPSQTSSVL
jgi:adenylate kinase family enzyme